MLCRALVPLLIFGLGGSVARAEPTQITFAGSSTVTRVLQPHKPSVEASAHVEIRLLPAGSGRGLVELAAGRADAAMLSGPLEYLLARVDASTSALLRAEPLDQLKLASSPKADVVAILHATNPLRRLTSLQFRDILTGKVTNWKELGGPDRPITVFLPDEMDGVRATLATSLLEGQPFTATARIGERVSTLPPLVAAEPGGIAAMARGSLAADATFAELEPALNVALFIVVKRARLESDAKFEQVVNSLHSRAR